MDMVVCITNSTSAISHAVFINSNGIEARTLGLLVREDLLESEAVQEERLDRKYV